MGQDFFQYLPSAIILDIFLRLPLRTIMICKCVCMPWLDLLETPEFVKCHLSISVPGFAVKELESYSASYKIFEFVDDVDLNCRLNKVFNFDLPFDATMYSSVDGLLFLNNIRLCNPITRDYIVLPSPPKPCKRIQSYGFGVSKVTGQYKVVRVFIEILSLRGDVECQIYTVGTGLWRWVDFDDPFRYEDNTVGAFLNGNLHWLAYKGSSTLISCLDLETELFSTFSAPLLEFDKWRSLSILRGCLCLCDNSGYSEGDSCEINIWLMKEYADGKSWTKEFVILKANLRDYLGFLRPIKIFKDGNILMEFRGDLLYYSSKTKTIQVASDMFGLVGCSGGATIFTPSFLSLEALAMEEDVTSF